MATTQNAIQWSNDYKKYRIILMATLCGLSATYNKDFDKVMLFGNVRTGGKDGNAITTTCAICIGDNMADKEYIMNMNALRHFYNCQRDALLAKHNTYRLQSQPFAEIGAVSSAANAYPENRDPIIYASDIIADLATIGKSNKAQILKENIEVQLSNAIEATKNSSWGKGISKSLQNFADKNLYILGSQLGQERD